MLTFRPEHYEDLYQIFLNLAPKNAVTLLHDLFTRIPMNMHGQKDKKLINYDQWKNLISVDKVNEIIHDKSWSMLQPNSFFNAGEVHTHRCSENWFIELPAPIFKVVAEYVALSFRGDNLLLMLQHFSQPRYEADTQKGHYNDTTNRQQYLEQSEQLLKQIKINNFNLEHAENQPIFDYFMNIACVTSVKSHQKCFLSGIEAALEHNYKPQKIMDWSVQFLKLNRDINVKEAPRVESLVQSLDKTELKKRLTLNEFNSLFTKNETGIIEQTVSALHFQIETMQLKKITEVPASIIKDNLKFLIQTLPSLLKDIEDFVHVSGYVEKSIVHFHLAFHETTNPQCVPLIRFLIDNCSKEPVRLPKNMKENLQNLCEKFLIAYNLETQLPVKENKNSRMKI